MNDLFKAYGNFDVESGMLDLSIEISAKDGRVEGYAKPIFKGLEIRNSTVTQIDAGVFPTTTPLVVGNGDLKSHGWIVGIAGSMSFPKKQP